MFLSAGENIDFIKESLLESHPESTQITQMLGDLENKQQKLGRG